MAQNVGFEPRPSIPNAVCYHYTTFCIIQPYEAGGWVPRGRLKLPIKTSTSRLITALYKSRTSSWRRNSIGYLAHRCLSYLSHNEYSQLCLYSVSCLALCSISLLKFQRRYFDFLPHFRKCPPVGNSLPASIIVSLSLVNTSQGRQYEVGCGSGTLLPHLSRKDERVTFPHTTNFVSYHPCFVS